MRYVGGMTRISVSIDDLTADAIKRAAGGDRKVSGWAAAVLRREMIRLSALAAAEQDRADDDREWEDARLGGAA
jgi:hypothetical protein